MVQNLNKSLQYKRTLQERLWHWDTECIFYTFRTMPDVDISDTRPQEKDLCKNCLELERIRLVEQELEQ